MTDAARSRRDAVRYEPQLAVPTRDPGAADPLAELARLVGQDDPFRNVFRTTAAQPRRAAPTAPVEVEHHADVARDPHDEGHREHDDAHHDQPHDGQGYDGQPHDGQGYDGQGYDVQGYDGQGYDAGVHEGEDGAHHHGHAQAEAHEGHHGYDDAHDERYYAAEQAAHPDEAALADERLAPASAAAAIPDLWARGEEDAVWSAPEVDHGHAPVERGRLDRSSARRPLAVLAAVLLLTGGGLAATFLARSTSASSTASAASGRAAPTIMAATGPTKVKIDDPGATAPEDQDAALLNKTGSVYSGPVKIVSSQEQPADLDQLPKADLADGARPLPPPMPSPFPEPKKVKTFLVHPDGTMLSSDTVTAPAGQMAAATPAPDGMTPAAQPATPRTAVRGGATPASPAPSATIASLTADPSPSDAAPPPRPARKPNDTAAGAPAAAGGYGLQVASSPVEADANAAFAKLKKKYPAQLGPYTATVHKADTGDKPVYRVRVGGMSQDEAKALCTQLQTAGGSCFVVHN